MTFTVTNQKTGTEFSVDPTETILDAATRHGYGFNYSCRSGSCGSCKGLLVSGSLESPAEPQTALSEADIDSGQILLCQARPSTNVVIEAIELPAGSSLPIRTLPCRVTVLEKARHDVMVVKLKLPQNQDFRFLPGQYVDILLRDGRRRSFSIANWTGIEEGLELHIRLVPDGHFSGQVFNSLKVRDLLRFQGPFGTFFLREDTDQPTIMVAGGTGLAPIKAILESAFLDQAVRPFHLFWGVRNAHDLYAHDLLTQWSEQYDNFNYTPVLSEPQEDKSWSGEQGWVHEAALRHFPDLSQVDVYASGPPPMIEALKNAFEDAGLAIERLYFDSFEYASDTA
ncbi:MAG: CDP-6-deoxy-delta-3,4-glucoseen reductase [Pseudomonadota bacterium]